MTDAEIRETIRQMMKDWNAATDEQREAALLNQARWPPRRPNNGRSPNVAKNPRWRRYLPDGEPNECDWCGHIHRTWAECSLAPDCDCSLDYATGEPNRKGKES